MRKQKTLLSLIALCITFFLVGCGTKSQNNKYPIDVSNKNFPEFGIAKIKSSIKPNEKVGSFSDTPFTSRFDYYYADVIAPETILGLYGALKGELGIAGYKISDDKARFLFGGTILSVEFNALVWGGKDVVYRASIRAEWEVYDEQKKEVIYSKKTWGKAEDWNVRSREPLINSAFRNSLRELLASNDFVDSIKKHVHD